jgi:hypothetical protein
MNRKWSKAEAVEGYLRLRLPHSREPYRMFYVARWIASELTSRMPALLGVTEWGIWCGTQSARFLSSGLKR